MTNEEYLTRLQTLREREVALMEEKAQLQRDYLDSQEFRVGDEVYYTPPTSRHYPPERELKGFIFSAEPSFRFNDVYIYYTVCLATKAGTLPKLAKNASYGCKETLNLRKVEASND